MNLQISPGGSSQQLTPMGNSPHNNLLNAHFRNNLKGMTSTPLNTQQNQSLAQQQQNDPVNGGSSNLHSQLIAQQQIQLAQHQQMQHHHQHQQAQNHKHLIALASHQQQQQHKSRGVSGGGGSSSSSDKHSYNRSSSNGSSGYNGSNGHASSYNKQFQFGANPSSGDINNLPELSSFLQWNQSNSQLPFSAMAQFQYVN